MSPIRLLVGMRCCWAIEYALDFFMPSRAAVSGIDTHRGSIALSPARATRRSGPASSGRTSECEPMPFQPTDSAAWERHSTRLSDPARAASEAVVAMRPMRRSSDKSADVGMGFGESGRTVCAMPGLCRVDGDEIYSWRVGWPVLRSAGGQPRIARPPNE